MKIIVYGIGSFFERNKHRLNKDEVLCYCDMNRRGEELDGKRILGPEDIKSISEYDAVYVTTETYWDSIVKTLISNGVPTDKIQFPFNEPIQISVEKNGELVGSYNGVSINLKCDSDYSCFYSDFILREYGVNFPFDNTVVFDLGMNSATTSLYFAVMEKVKKVYGFEPFLDTYNNAVANIARNGEIGKKIVPINVALCDKDYVSEIPVYEDNNTGGRTTFEDFFDNPVYVEGRMELRKEKIEYKDARTVLEGLVSEGDKEEHLVLKIDVEGSEFDIFRSLENSWIFDKTEVILMEFHREPSYLTDILEKKNFRYLKNYWDTERGMIFAFKYQF